jgi:hypothetical protein
MICNKPWGSPSQALQSLLSDIWTRLVMPRQCIGPSCDNTLCWGYYVCGACPKDTEQRKCLIFYVLDNSPAIYEHLQLKCQVYFYLSSLSSSSHPLWSSKALEGSNKCMNWRVKDGILMLKEPVIYVMLFASGFPRGSSTRNQWQTPPSESSAFGTLWSININSNSNLSEV